MAQLQAQVDDAEEKRLQDGDKDDDDAPTSSHRIQTVSYRNANLPASVATSPFLQPLHPQLVQRRNFENPVTGNSKILFLPDAQFLTNTDTFGPTSQRQSQLLDRADESGKLNDKQGSEFLRFPEESSNKHENLQHIGLDVQSNGEAPGKLCMNYLLPSH